MNMPKAHLHAGLDPAERRRLFAIWLRTGRLPTLRDDGVELKFNPWHDPRDGRFTSGPEVDGGTKIALTEDRELPPVRTRAEADAWRADQLSRYGERSDNRAAIDGALSAEDTPAHVQLARAADAVANASPRELGHAVGATAAEVGIAVVPGAAINKIARLRRLSALAPREQLLPPDIG